MKRLFSLAWILIVASIIMVAQTRYCLSYEDFKNDKWVEIKQPVKATLKNTIGLGDMVFTTEDKELDKILKKEARFIVHDDILYVNNRKLKGKGTSMGKNYTQAFRYGQDSVCVVGPRGVKGGTAALYFSVNLAVNILLVPCTGTAVTVLPLRESYPVCYLMTSDQKKLQMITPGDIDALLADDPVAQSYYNAYDKKQKESAKVVLQNLEELELLKAF